MNPLIRKMQKSDWSSVQSIYIEGIRTGTATFETNVPEWMEWNKNHLRDCRIVISDSSIIYGWAALSPVSQRDVYSGVAEVSIYIKESERGKGIGKKLLEELIKSSEKAGIWTLQAAIFPENEASIHLFKKCGFRVIGYREKIGKLNGIWKDVVLMERRSKIIT